jgi:hypothetical protein
MTEIQCKCCREWMPEDCFQRDFTMTSGRLNTCRGCKSAKKREWAKTRQKKPDAVAGPARRIMASPECNMLADSWRYTVTTGQLVPTLGWIVPELGRAA